MLPQIKKLTERWKAYKQASFIFDSDIEQFQTEKSLVIPDDLALYFKVLNGTHDEYTDELFRFNSFFKYKSIDEELKHFNGIPDYSNIINTLEGYKNCFVFGTICSVCFLMLSVLIRIKIV